MNNTLSTNKTNALRVSFFDSNVWRKTTFQFVLGACIFFAAATLMAMLAYGGGTSGNPQNAGYSFFTNFFSDLGRTVSYNGAPNTISMLLFSSALTIAGAGLAVFFVAFTQFFTHTRWTRVLSIIGSIVGIASALCFVGVAFTPADIARPLHGQFVLYAFGLFPLAVILYIPVILDRDEYPNLYAWSFIAFAVVLILYFILLRIGPRANTPEGLLIQATGQKIIVYASILSILFQTLGARHVNAKLGN